MNGKLTFMENYIWSNLGWVFCEISYKCPHWFWAKFGCAWPHTLGTWFYGLAYDRTDAPPTGVRLAVKGGGTGPF